MQLSNKYAQTQCSESFLTNMDETKEGRGKQTIQQMATHSVCASFRQLILSHDNEAK